MDNFGIPGLDTAARHLGLDAGELAEAVLHAVDTGADEMEAVRMTIIEVLQRRGAYRGRLKQAVEDGTIFQMSEGGNGDSGPIERPGKPFLRKTTAAPSSPSKRFGADDA
ncbi:MAG: hypothetical protein LUE17_05390 [Planctomycetaceae bacterium]|nr:hypothetical protein [Planctomycetaceae bacterium]